MFYSFYTNIFFVSCFRKNLYQNLYEYDLPLFNPAPCKFDFVKPEDSEYENPWKESFKQLYHGVHVRPGYSQHTNKVTLHQSGKKGQKSYIITLIDTM